MTLFLKFAVLWPLSNKTLVNSQPFYDGSDYFPAAPEHLLNKRNGGTDFGGGEDDQNLLPEIA